MNKGVRNDHKVISKWSNWEITVENSTKRFSSAAPFCSRARMSSWMLGANDRSEASSR